MWRLAPTGSAAPTTTKSPPPVGARRDRLAVQLALVTVIGVGLAFVFSKGTRFLMPGPLTSAHGAIEACSTCHTKSGTGKLSWVHGLVAGDPLADSKACLTCHKMPDTAFNAHSASAEVLKQSTERLAKIAARTPPPPSARAQGLAFPTHDVVARGLYCATCHQDHQGANFNVAKISGEQCRSCHVVKFDSFDGQHPKFESYPFKRRTRIAYDHAGHFGKHFPEVAKKDPARRIPATCSTCHDSREDKRLMAVAPFERTCTACHLDQIIGKERATGPKGIAFVSLPGLDVQTLKTKNRAIGEWPDASDAALTPFMKMMISRTARGRALVETVGKLNLQDLAAASDDEIKAVAELVWEIKGLFHALIKGKASDVLGDFNIGGGAKPSAELAADLTASLPRDVIVGAQQQWLPNLAAEMANRPAAGTEKPAGWSTQITGSEVSAASPAPAPSGSAARQEDTSEPGKEAAEGDAPSPDDADDAAETDSASLGTDAAAREPAPKAVANPQACLVRVFGQCVVSKAPPPGAETDPPADAAKRADRGKEKPSATGLPRPMQAGLAELAQVALSEGAAKATEPAAGEPPRKSGTDQTDDLLFPTEEELRAMKAVQPDAAGQTQPASANAPAPAEAATTAPAPGAAPVISIDSDVDPESWAEFGGWYRQDYAIYYRPAGHKDKFVYAWLFLTGPHAPKGEPSPAAAIFDSLTGKDAQGSCTKCHSVDDIPGKGRLVNFSPASVAGKQGQFTAFVHEPHFGVLENKGCLTCHSLEKSRPFMKSYEQGNPREFASGFGAVKKELCQSCHTGGMARQDCLLCHKYHVNDAITPVMSTKIPNP